MPYYCHALFVAWLVMFWCRERNFYIHNVFSSVNGRVHGSCMMSAWYRSDICLSANFKLNFKLIEHYLNRWSYTLFKFGNWIEYGRVQQTSPSATANLAPRPTVRQNKPRLCPTLDTTNLAMCPLSGTANLVPRHTVRHSKTATKWAWQVMFWCRERNGARCTASFRCTVCLSANFKLLIFLEWMKLSALQIGLFRRSFQWLRVIEPLSVPMCATLKSLD